MQQQTPASPLREACKAAQQSRDLNTYSGLLRYARNDEGGNALIFILIAIALLGLLTVTLSRSGDSTNDTGDFEQNQIAASEILAYAKSIENAVQSLLARGCSENEISFWHDSDGNGTEDGGDDYYNDKSPTDRFCHVFDVAGAGMTFTDLSKSIASGLDFSIAVSSQPRVLKGIGYDDRVDIYFSIKGPPSKINDFCEAINRMVNIPKTGTASAGVFDPETASIQSLQNEKFTGSYQSPIVTVFDVPAINGKSTFCVGHLINLTIFSHVLLAR